MKSKRGQREKIESQLSESTMVTGDCRVGEIVCRHVAHSSISCGSVCLRNVGSHGHATRRRRRWAMGVWSVDDTIDEARKYEVGSLNMGVATWPRGPHGPAIMYWVSESRPSSTRGRRRVTRCVRVRASAQRPPSERPPGKFFSFFLPKYIYIYYNIYCARRVCRCIPGIPCRSATGTGNGASII